MSDLRIDALRHAAGRNLDQTKMDELRTRDSELLHEISDYVRDTRAQLHGLLLGNKITETGTGMNAHYRFENLPSGSYAVFAEWPLGRRTYQWWAPVVLEDGQRLTRDLDNSTEVSETFFCGIGTQGSRE